MKRDENMEWKEEAPLLASLPKTTPYRVPESYFNELTAQINNAVFLNELALNEKHGFAVPSNYFEELGNQIEAKIAVDHLKTKVLQDGYTTPPQYFDKLHANIISKTTSTKKEVKVLRLWHTDLMKYASAACFIILMASGLYVKQQNALVVARNNEIANEQMLYDIDESVIIEHLNESEAVATNASTDAEMESYILNNFSSSDLTNNL